MLLLFAGGRYYPGGGWNDFKGEFKTLDEAKEYVARLNNIDWFHVIDFETQTEVWEGDRD
jgi:hypothetical protein